MGSLQRGGSHAKERQVDVTRLSSSSGGGGSGTAARQVPVRLHGTLTSLLLLHVTAAAVRWACSKREAEHTRGGLSPKPSKPTVDSSSVHAATYRCCSIADDCCKHCAVWGMLGQRPWAMAVPRCECASI